MPAAHPSPPFLPTSSPTSPTALISSLLATLASISASTTTDFHHGSTASATTTALYPTNAQTPSQLLPESTRPLLLTLHVLFPHALLDALDLLDRGLVVKVLVHGDGDGDREAEIGDATTDEKGVTMTKWRVLSSQTAPGSEYRGEYHGRRGRREWNGIGGGGYGNGNGTGHGDRGTSGGNWRERGHGYASQHGRHDDEHDDSTERPTGNARMDLEMETEMGMATSYTVALRAWNCSCPAFAFAAFTGGGASAASSLFANSATAAALGRSGGCGRGHAEEGSDADVAMDMNMDMDVDTATTSDLYPPNIPLPRTADWTRKEALWQRLHNSQGRDSTSSLLQLPFGGLAVSSTSSSTATATTAANSANADLNLLEGAVGSETASLPPAPASSSESQALPATCKHLLAALLASKCPELFGPFPQTQSGDGSMGTNFGRRGVVLRELRGQAEAAGWAVIEMTIP